MIAAFEFMTAGKIVFGCGAAAQLPEIVCPLGHTIMLVRGQNPQRSAALAAALKKNGVVVTEYAVGGEPTLESVNEAAALARAAHADAVVGIGGGSVLDTAKAVAAMMTNEGSLLDYLEVIGGGRKLTAAPVPWVAVPTTAGTGSEVTKNAVIGSTAHGVKASLRDNRMLAYTALIDPELTLSVPPAITAAVGLDALTQLIEAFVTWAANPLTDAVCKEGIRLAAGHLRIAYEDGANIAARSAMAAASLMGGLALANAKLGAVHGFAGVIGGRYNIGHGEICAALLPGVMRMNVRTLKKRGSGANPAARFDLLGPLLTSRPDAKSFHAVEWLEELCEALHIKKLGTYEVAAADADAVVAQAKQAGSMKGNPIELTDVELKEVFLGAI